MSQNTDSTDEEHVIPKLFFNMKDESLIIKDPSARTIFDNGYFGQWTDNSALKLEPEEILLLIDRGRIEIWNQTKNQPITSSELVDHFTDRNKDFWSRYLVYKDLRNRGYVVRIGTRITAPFRIYSRGGKPGESISKIVVFPLSEGEELNLDFLDQIVNQTKIDRKKLLLSVVDQLGDVTYYQASQLELEPNELEYEYRDELELQNEKTEVGK
ncbi:MAG: tRNA-intron lyase [Candidatus Hodarchaeales archaeon]|jgi:tRNA-intron endonuclease